MALMHLARDGAKIGSFSREEVQEGLRTGKFLPTDLVWEEGMPNWRPLSEVMPQTADTPPPLATTLSIPSVPASGVDSTPAGGPNDVQVSGLPWDNRKQLGLVKAFIDTVAMVLTQPSLAFSLMKKEGDFIGPTLFAVIGGTIGLIASQIYELSLNALMPTTGTALGLGSRGFWSIVVIVVAPVIVLAGVFFSGAILHLCLMLLGGAKQPFETTFRVVSFSLGATYLLMLAPVCGGLISSVWAIVAECIGLARAHEIDTGRAVAAVLLPLVVCCTGIIFLGFLFGGLGLLNGFSQH